MSADFKRTDRVGDRLWQELAVLLKKEVSDPRVSWVTISGVDVSPNFSHAKIYYTVLMEEKALAAQEALEKASGFLRHLLAKRLRLRTVPSLRFIYDETILKARKMDQLIAKANNH